MTKDHLHTVMQLSLRVLTPVHVGAGPESVWRQHLDFATRGKKIFVFERESLFERLARETASDGRNGLDAYMRRVSDAQGNRVDRLLQEELDIDLEDVSSASFEYTDEPSPEIRPLIRTGMGVPIIPGSSLKGALRSVLFHHLWHRYGEGARDKGVDNRMLGSFERAITRYISLSDVEIPQTRISNIALFNLKKQVGDWKSFYGKKGVPSNLLITVETFSAGAESHLRLSLADGWLNRIREAAKTPKYREGAEGVVHGQTKNIIVEQNPVQHLLRMINEYTREHLRREIAFFEEYPQAEFTDFIIHNLKEIRKKTENNPRSCVLRLGYGSGYHGITGDWNVDDHLAAVEDPIYLKMYSKVEEPFRFKSRRIAMDMALTATCMGFVEISLPAGTPDIHFQPVLPVDEPSQVISEKGAKLLPKTLEATPVSFANLKPNAVFHAEVLEVGKPFSKVRLLIEDYPFEPYAQLSGTKKVNLKPGLIVEVVINSRAQSGEIKSVTYHGA